MVGAEFSCTVPDYNIGIHVLTYGFDEEQEKMLKKLRKNIYIFQEYTKEFNLPTIWAHPLYHYSPKGIPPFDFYDKMSLIFERFEVLNGQRDTWQNMLVKLWIDSLTPEKIDQIAARTGINPDHYCRDPYKKSRTGGSDSHMGIFSGLTGTYLHIPDLKQKLHDKPASELALEAIRMGRTAPFGSHQNSEKLTIAFLDYVCQIALNGTDPGLLRILLHKGTSNDKIIALLVSNGFAELRQHKVTMRFIELFHQCLIGKTPAFTKKWFIPRVYKPVFSDAVKIAETKQNDSEKMVEIYGKSIFSINSELNKILFNRLKIKIENFTREKNITDLDFNELIANFELPSEFRAYMDDNNSHLHPDIPKILDGLPFPFLASALILAAHFTSARVLYNARPLLQTFAEKLGHLEHPRRALWLTDTFEDRNGVSMVLKDIHDEINKRTIWDGSIMNYFQRSILLLIY
ncbi:MAG: hypothetical protein NTX61_13705 [Bacteroidetes bacterium]|nr:hypothetical protein [Bacteroidota bacterium]